MACALHAERVRKDIAEGQAAGVTGTPAFFLGVTAPDGGKLKAVRSITGAQAYSAFKAAIDNLLSEQK
jgi:protein-disulfide isomerase